jgi:adenine-specific DNA-methyltransferase
MPMRSTDSLAEPQALFGFLTPALGVSRQVAIGGCDSYSTEPINGREHAKIRELGQVATPSLLANALARWVASASPAEILDPALGLGNLLHACHSLVPSAKLEGIEIDPDIVLQARHTAPMGTGIFCGNYLRMRVRPRSAIIANPPYIKAARLNIGEADWAGFEDMFNCRLDRSTNAYAIFLLKIWHDLAPLGRAAVLIPSEFLNANYGVEIKRKLLSHLRPVATLVLDPSLNAFDTALTTSTILLLEKSPAVRMRMPAYLVRALADLQSVISTIATDPASTAPVGLAATDLSSFAPEEKWLNRILGQHEENSALTHRVGDYFRCSRGIATGANEYFCLRPSELAAHRLDSRYFLPCVTKAPDIGGLVFTHNSHRTLQTEDKRCWLLAPTEEPNTEMQRYLALGKSTGIADKFLPSHRPVWFLPENRTPAHAWVAVFSRETLKCVLNETTTRHLTCFHGIYARSGIAADAASIVLFLNSSLGRIAIRRTQRFYGDGLNKLEPKDVEAIPCPSLAPRSDILNRNLVSQLKLIEALPVARQPLALDALAEATFGLTPQAVA